MQFKINQIVRSPGIYFEKNLKEKSITCTIIPEKGSWLTIKLDKCSNKYKNIQKKGKLKKKKA